MAQGNFELAAIPLHHPPKSEDHRHRPSCLAKLQLFWVRFFLKGMDMCVLGHHRLRPPAPAPGRPWWEILSPGSPAKPHYLAVANSRVSERIGSQHSPKSSDSKLILESGVLGHGAVEVSLDLLSSQAVFPHGLLH